MHGELCNRRPALLLITFTSQYVSLFWEVLWFPTAPPTWIALNQFLDILDDKLFLERLCDACLAQICHLASLNERVAHTKHICPSLKRFCDFFWIPTDGVPCVTQPVSGLPMLDLHPIRIPSMRDPICILSTKNISNWGCKCEMKLKGAKKYQSQNPYKQGTIWCENYVWRWIGKCCFVRAVGSFKRQNTLVDLSFVF